MHRIRGKLTYANVMATIAVFIALGGAGYAAVKLPKNSVGTRQIKNNAITGAKIKNGAVSGSKIATGSLGTVPSATHASTADTATKASSADTATTATTANEARTLGGLTAGQIAAAAQLKCPAGTILAAGECFDSTQRAEGSYEVALQTCATAGMALPSIGEMAAFLATTKIAEEQDWAGSPFTDEGGFRAPVAEGDKGNVVFAVANATTPAGFRCEIPPTN